MKIARPAVQKSVVTGFTTAILLTAGAFAYFTLGQLEDPEFTVKDAVVTCTYPGASAEEVELEVTDRIEIAIQEMPQLRKVESLSRAGLAIISVQILPEYGSDELPQVWDELRKRVGDVQSSLPPGAGEPVVGDDFGDVFGFLFALTGDGFDYAELEDYADALKKDLSLVPGVARVELWGVQQRAIYIDVRETQLTQLGITKEALKNTLRSQNLVVDSGGVDLPGNRLRIEQTGAFDSPEDIENLVIRGMDVGKVLGLKAPSTVQDQSDELLRIRDIATVRRGFVEPPIWNMRYNGQPAMAISISNVSGANIVTLGQSIDRRLSELTANLPIGVEFHRISWQSEAVSESISSFMISLAQAVVIVTVVLWLAMGFRVATIVNLGGLVFVIVGTFLAMALFGINLERMSLGALIVAMGMMVDNAIVVVDGILIRMQKGMNRREAAIEAATLPSMPLLGATVIAVMAFFPIYASDESAGEYCATLFMVIAIALLISWVLSVTITPLLCIWLLPEPRQAGSADDGDQFQGRIYKMFRGVLVKAIRFRFLVVTVMLGLLAAALFGFQYVDKTFFPASARLQLMIDYWAPEGTKIQTVTRDMSRIEQRLLDDTDKVVSVSSFIGQGPPRFYLPVEPEKPYSSYGQFIVNLKDLQSLNALIPEISKWMDENVPQAETVVRRYGLGPSETWKVEARISGPAVADPETLRSLGDRGMEILRGSPYNMVARTNWRQRTQKVVAEYDQQRARWARITRSNVAEATRRAFDGFLIGQYREEDKLYPILLRHVEAERRALPGQLRQLQVLPSFSTDPVPLSQVTGGINVEWEDPLIWRYNRRRTITVQAVPPDGVTAARLRDSVLGEFAQLEKELPPGYDLEWGGEFESSRDAQQSLIPGMIPAAVVMSLIIVALFNDLRPPLAALLVIPFALIGVTVGLLTTGNSFGFLALLGVMSLSGMMIKNAIVLLDQINIEKESGKSPYDAVIDSATLRLRSVALAAATTVLGMIPLLKDVFWVAMAVAIMAGLAFGTILTMILLPVIYSMLFKIRPQ